MQNQRSTKKNPWGNYETCVLEQMWQMLSTSLPLTMNIISNTNSWQAGLVIGENNNKKGDCTQLLSFLAWFPAQQRTLHITPASYTCQHPGANTHSSRPHIPSKLTVPYLLMYWEEDPPPCFALPSTADRTCCCLVFFCFLETFVYS